jgi:hypothetical protein
LFKFKARPPPRTHAETKPIDERRPTAPQSPQSFLTHRSTAIDPSAGIQANYYDGKACASINCPFISSAQRTQFKLCASRLQKTPPNISNLFAKDPLAHSIYLVEDRNRLPKHPQTTRKPRSQPQEITFHAFITESFHRTTDPSFINQGTCLSMLLCSLSPFMSFPAALVPRSIIDAKRRYKRRKRGPRNMNWRLNSRDCTGIHRHFLQIRIGRRKS